MIRLISLLVGALIAALYCHARVDALLTTRPEESSQLMVPSAHAVKLVSLGFDRSLADFYWLQFIAYIGDTKARGRDRYALSDRYIDLITSLDPQFVQAYWFAAFNIGGDVGRPQRASELIERGIQANPDDWYLPYIAGVNEYVFAKDDLAAAKYYRMASKFPNAPAWLMRQAVILESNTPRLAKDASSWLQIYDSTNGEVKARAKDECVKLWVKIYRNAPTDVIRQRARETLKALGIDDEILRGSLTRMK